MPQHSNTTESGNVLSRLRSLRQPDMAPGLNPASAQAPVAESTGILTQPQPSGVTRTKQPGILDKLRSVRDDLLLEKFANNPLQRAAFPLLSAVNSTLDRVPVGPGTALDVVENIGKGAAIGSILIPDDSAVDPENPIPAIQTAGIFLGAIGEGAVSELGILYGLNAVKGAATARGAKNVAASADKALRIFGQGEDLGKFRQIIGGAALGGASEVGLQAAALQDPGDILKAAGLVSVVGGALGGAIAGLAVAPRTVRAGSRALRSFTEEFAEKEAREGVPKLLAVSKHQGEVAASAGNSADEMGILSKAGLEQRIADAEAAVGQAQKIQEMPPTGPLPTPSGRTANPAIEAVFDQDSGRSFVQRIKDGFESAHETFRESFIFEAKLQHLPSLSGVDGLTLGDDIRVLNHAIERSSRLADTDLSSIIAPLRDNFKGDDFTAAWRAFERIVVLRDLLETQAKGLDIPIDISAKELRQELLKLETTSPRPVLEAAENHRQMFRSIKEDLIRRGKLEVGDGYEDYYPHNVIEDLADEDAALTGVKRKGSHPTTSAMERGKLKTPSRPYTRQRLGSKRGIDTDYIDTIFRAIRRYHADNAIDDFIKQIEASPLAKVAKHLPDEVKQKLSRTGRAVIDGEVHQVFRPRGAAHYRAQAVDEEAWNTLVQKVRADDGVDLAGLADEIPALREVLAVGRPKELILPKALTDRLEQFYQPDPLRGTLTTPFAKAVSWWKRNTIHWGLSRFFMFQVVGDSVNALRSNPASFLQIRNGRLDSPLVRAINETFGKYGTPVMSGEQLFGSLAFGAGGLALDEGLRSEDPSTLEKVGSILAGAGLGYMVGTHRVAGRGRAFGQMYDAADELAAINSGFVHSEEALARRVLGESSSLLPTTDKTPWERSLDTFTTLLSGKAHGDPYGFARIPAEVIEVVQRERENMLRLASYMQQVEKGIDPRIAAKRARESLVDYGKFTPFENKIIRGFWLPFYAFYRHNTPNWVKAAVGRDVGGKAKVGMAAVGVLAAGDIAAQMWNEKFFPEIEEKLQGFRRDRFHIIVGNPATGEAYTDEQGRPMVVGWEMPYETALEFFGLARPGVVYSELFGIGGTHEDVSLVERFQKSAEEIKNLKSGPGKMALDLLNPFLKEAVQIGMNKDFFYDAPIVPDRYLGTPEEKGMIREHVTETFFRQYREFKRLVGDVGGQRFDPLTSAVGLGLPIDRINLDREIQGMLHEQMDEATQEQKELDARWKKPIDDLVYGREEFSKPAEGELLEVQQRLFELGLEPHERERAFRYYMKRGGEGTIMRRWKSLSTEEKLRFYEDLPDFGKTALFYYLNFNEPIPTEPSGGLGILGN